MIGTFYVWAALLVFLATAGLGFIGLPILQRLNVGQKQRELGPKSHLKKDGTPTFGGVLFIIPITLAGFIMALLRPEWGTLSLTLFSLALGAIGFADDYVKVRVNKKGLSEKQKSIAILSVVILFAVWYLYLRETPPFFIMPFSQAYIEITGIWKLLYLIFMVFYFYACTNAVNFADGIDGLCVSVTAVVAFFMATVAVRFADSFAEQGLTDMFHGQGLLSVILLAGCLGFLVHNRHVARVFMGDTGSLMLGALVSGIMMLQGYPWAFLLAGVIYVAEIGSVLLQRIYFRKTGGKRIFLMSPIHHHYELKGWSEWKIVIVFSAVTLAGSVLSYLVLRV